MWENISQRIRSRLIWDDELVCGRPMRGGAEEDPSDPGGPRRPVGGNERYRRVRDFLGLPGSQVAVCLFCFFSMHLTQKTATVTEKRRSLAIKVGGSSFWNLPDMDGVKRNIPGTTTNEGDLFWVTLTFSGSWSLETPFWVD